MSLHLNHTHLQMNERFIRQSHCVYNLGYHVIFCPKYRRRILNRGIDERLKTLLNDKAIDMACTIEKMEVMPDHVHVFIKTPTTLSVDEMVRGLKGYSSYMLRKEYAWLRRLPSLWSPSYYVESIGHISENTVRKYIEDQKVSAVKKERSLSSHG